MGDSAVMDTAFDIYNNFGFLHCVFVLENKQSRKGEQKWRLK